MSIFEGIELPAGENATSPLGKDATVGRRTLCTMASNVDKTVALLMAARRFPPALHDLINDVWSPGAMGTARFEGATWHGAMVQVPNDRNEPRPDEAAWRGRGADSAEPEAEATARGRRREGA